MKIESFDLECLEKALRGDKRFTHLLEEPEKVIWWMFLLLEEADAYQSYLGLEAFAEEYNAS